jgi:hypothetical protein
MTWHTLYLSLIFSLSHSYHLIFSLPRRPDTKSTAAQRPAPTPSPASPTTKTTTAAACVHDGARWATGQGASQTRSAVQASSAVDAAGAATSQASSPATMADGAGTRGRSGGVPSAAAAVNVGVARRRGRSHRREA